MAPPRGQLRAGRYLAALAVILIALYALVFLQGSGSVTDKLTPRLGLDLQGGTTVTLHAAQQNGKAPDAEQLEQARQIIENRVNGTGVAEAEVVTEGDSNIVINAPGENNDAIKQVGEPAQLRFRAVLESAQDIDAIEASAAAAATPTPTTSGTANPTSSGSAAPSTSASASPSTSSSAKTNASPSASGNGGGGSDSTAAAGGGGGGGAPAAAPAAVPAAEDTPVPSTSASPSVAASPSTSAAATPSGSASPTPNATPTSPSQAALQKSALAKFPEDAATYVEQGTAEDFAGAATNPQLAAIFEPAAKKLTEAEVAALPLDWQFKVPWITCKMLTDRPAGSVDAVDQQVVACDGTTKYKLEKAGVVGTDIDTASFTFDQQQGGWVVNLKFTGKGQDKWTELTKATLQKQVAVVLDNSVISAPTTNEVITGDTQISGQFTKAEAQDLAAKLKFGALPLSFTVETAETISPTLGIEQLEAGLLAGGIGLGLVVVYSLIYYRALGLVTIASLAMSGLIIYASIILLGRQIGLTLTLAGVAGFIVAVGITADSFVVFFERLKDEVRDGRSVRSAVPRAWARARRTILSADAVSFLAAAVLYTLAVGAVKGFAFTLGLSTLVDVIIVFLFTHPLVALLARSRRFTSPRFTGLGTLRKGSPGSGVSDVHRAGASGRPAATARRVSPKES